MKQGRKERFSITIDSYNYARIKKESKAKGLPLSTYINHIFNIHFFKEPEMIESEIQYHQEEIRRLKNKYLKYKDKNEIKIMKGC